MNIINTLSGLRCIGTAKDPHCNGGTELPLYEPAAPRGKLSINTLEGWNALCSKIKHPQLIEGERTEAIA